MAPSTFRGTPTGPAVDALARLLEGDEVSAAAKRLADKYPFLHGRFVPWVHRRRRYQTVYYELTATP